MSWRAEATEFVVRRTTGTDADISAAIAAALRTNETRKMIVVPGGDWTFNSPIVVAKEGVGAFMHLTIVGAHRVFPGLTEQPRFLLQYDDKPGIVIQGGRQVHISGLEIIGQNSFVGSLSGIDDVVDDAQMLVGAARNNRYSPHCGIAIDPFTASAPGGSEANKYPGLGAYYSAGFANLSGGGSLIDNVAFRDLVVGVTNSCGAAVGGGDNLKIRDSYFQGCRTGYASGQGQTKTCILEDCHFLYGLHAQDAVTYGARQGAPAAMRGGDIGWTKAALNIHHSIGMFESSGGGFLSEATHGLGQLGYGASSVQEPLIITGREVNLWNALAARSIDVHIVTFRPTIFQGVVFNVNDSTGPPGGSAGTIRIHNSNLEWLQFIGCSFNADAPNGHLPLDFNWPETVEMVHCKNRSADLHGVGQAVAEVQVGGPGDLTFLSPGKAQFTAFSGAAAVDVGDHIRLSAQYQPRQYAPDGSGFNTATSVGTVIAKNGDVITLGQVPESIEAVLPITGTSFFRRRFTFA